MDTLDKVYVIEKINYRQDEGIKNIHIIGFVCDKQSAEKYIFSVGVQNKEGLPQFRIREISHHPDFKAFVCPDLFANIDWKMLRNQKTILIMLASRWYVAPVYKETIDGIISLIDSIQDEAAEALGNETVFGEQA